MKLDTRPAEGEASARRLISYVLAAAVFAGAASMRILDTLLPQLAKFYQVSAGTTGAAVSAYAVSYSICQLLYGPWGDRIGPYRIITIAALLSGIAALGCAMAPTLPYLVILRLLAGGVAAAIGPLALAWVSHAATTQEDRIVAVARITGASIFGATAGQIGGGLIGQLYGWQCSFVFVAALFSIAGLGLWRVGKRHPHYRSLGRNQGGAADTGADRFVSLVRRHAVRNTLMAVGIEGFAMYMTFTYASALLHARLAVGTAAIGLLIAFYGIGGLTFVILSRRIARFGSEAQRAIIGGCLVAAGFLMLIVVNSLVTAACALFTIGLGFFMLHNVLQLRATNMAPEATAAGIALFAATFFLGQAAGAAVGGWLFDDLGASVSCVASAVLISWLGVAVGRTSTRSTDIPGAERRAGPN